MYLLSLLIILIQPWWIKVLISVFKNDLIEPRVLDGSVNVLIVQKQVHDQMRRNVCFFLQVFRSPSSPETNSSFSRLDSEHSFQETFAEHSVSMLKLYYITELISKCAWSHSYWELTDALMFESPDECPHVSCWLTQCLSARSKCGGETHQRVASVS